jgi:hypothetical protein
MIQQEVQGAGSVQQCAQEAAKDIMKYRELNWYSREYRELL